MVVSPADTSVGVAVNVIVNISISASALTLLAKSPADPMLDSSDDTLAVEMSVSREEDWLEQVKGADACAVIPMAIIGHIIDSMH